MLDVGHRHADGLMCWEVLIAESNMPVCMMKLTRQGYAANAIHLSTIIASTAIIMIIVQNCVARPHRIAGSNQCAGHAEGIKRQL